MAACVSGGQSTRRARPPWLSPFFSDSLPTTSQRSPLQHSSLINDHDDDDDDDPFSPVRSPVLPPSLTRQRRASYTSPPQLTSSLSGLPPRRNSFSASSSADLYSTWGRSRPALTRSWTTTTMTLMARRQPDETEYEKAERERREDISRRLRELRAAAPPPSTPRRHRLMTDSIVVQHTASHAVPTSPRLPPTLPTIVRCLDRRPLPTALSATQLRTRLDSGNDNLRHTTGPLRANVSIDKMVARVDNNNNFDDDDGDYDTLRRTTTTSVKINSRSLSMTSDEDVEEKLKRVVWTVPGGDEFSVRGKERTRIQPRSTSEHQHQPVSATSPAQDTSSASTSCLSARSNLTHDATGDMNGTTSGTATSPDVDDFDTSSDQHHITSSLLSVSLEHLHNDIDHDDPNSRLGTRSTHESDDRSPSPSRQITSSPGPSATTPQSSSPRPSTISSPEPSTTTSQPSSPGPSTITSQPSSPGPSTISSAGPFSTTSQPSSPGSSNTSSHPLVPGLVTNTTIQPCLSGPTTISSPGPFNTTSHSSSLEPSTTAAQSSSPGSPAISSPGPCFTASQPSSPGPSATTSQPSCVNLDPSTASAQEQHLVESRPFSLLDNVAMDDDLMGEEEQPQQAGAEQHTEDDDEQLDDTVDWTSVDDEEMDRRQKTNVEERRWREAEMTLQGENGSENADDDRRLRSQPDNDDSASVDNFNAVDTVRFVDQVDETFINGEKHQKTSAERQPSCNPTDDDTYRNHVNEESRAVILQDVDNSLNDSQFHVETTTNVVTHSLVFYDVDHQQTSSTATSMQMPTFGAELDRLEVPTGTEMNGLHGDIVSQAGRIIATDCQTNYHYNGYHGNSFHDDRELSVQMSGSAETSDVTDLTTATTTVNEQHNGMTTLIASELVAQRLRPRQMQQQNDAEAVIEEVNLVLKKNCIGLGFCITGGRDILGGRRSPIVIKRMFKGDTWAKGVLQAGDELAYINGVNLSDMTQHEAWDFLRDIPDGLVHLKIRRKQRQDQFNFDP